MSNSPDETYPPFKVQIAERVTRLPPYLFGRINGMLHNKRRAGDDVIAVVSRWRPGEPVWHGAVGGEPIAVQVRTTQNGMTLSHAGTAADARVYSRREAEAAALMRARRPVDAGTQLRSPMPGVIVSIAVTPGQRVKTGDALCIVEAMKMENILRAERDGMVTNVHARAGDVVAVDAPIMEFDVAPG